MKFLNESIYWNGTGRISHCLNRLPQEVLGCAPAISLMIFFCKVKIFPLLEELPKKIILYFTTEWKHSKFVSVDVTDMDYQADGITCSTSSESFAQYSSSN